MPTRRAPRCNGGARHTLKRTGLRAARTTLGTPNGSERVRAPTTARIPPSAGQNRRSTELGGSRRPGPSHRRSGGHSLRRIGAGALTAAIAPTSRWTTGSLYRAAAPTRSRTSFPRVGRATPESIGSPRTSSAPACAAKGAVSDPHSASRRVRSTAKTRAAWSTSRARLRRRCSPRPSSIGTLESIAAPAG